MQRFLKSLAIAMCFWFSLIAGTNTTNAQSMEPPAIKTDKTLVEPTVAESATAQAARDRKVEDHPQTWIELISRFAAVLSAIVGAGLAFLAAQYNEKRNWLRKKAEQLRDKQFASLAATARTFASTTQKLTSFQEQTGALESRSHVGTVDGSVARAELKASIDGWLGQLSAVEVELNLALIDLRLLKIADETQTAVKSTIDAVRKAIRLLEQWKADGHGYSQSLIIPIVAQVKAQSDLFIKNALTDMGR